MAAFARLVFFGFLFLTAIYVVISIWSRSVRREKLEREWHEQGRPGDKDAYIKAGMTDYENSLRRKLILLVYVIPTVAVAVIIYVTNFM